MNISEETSPLTVVPKGCKQMELNTIRICVPTEAVSLNLILGQAIYLDDKCFIIKSVALSEQDSSMVNLNGVLKVEKRKASSKPHFIRSVVPDVDQAH